MGGGISHEFSNLEARIKPIFIFSLPRSGSTLLQRMLTAHASVASASEPWILLPLIGMAGNEGVHTYSNYSSSTSQMAVDDFYAKSPEGWKVLHDSIRSFLNVSYGAYCKNEESYFLDKTPRYYLIIDEIYKIFPDAKCIFLFRSPLEVTASMIRTWSKGSFKLHHQHVDLHYGARCLHHGYIKYKSKSFRLSYDDLVADSDTAMRDICAYLGLEYDINMVENFSEVNFLGRMGDPIGIKKYSRVSANTNDGWRRVLSSPVRRWYCKKYIHSLGDDVLHSFGFSGEELLEDLLKESVQYGSIVSDLFWVMASSMYRMFVSKLLRNSLKEGVLRNEFID